MEKAYVNERGQFPESVRHGTEAFKITYIFETDIEWLGHFSDDENEDEEDQEEMINDAKELHHVAQSPLHGDKSLTDGDNADTENFMEEMGEAVDTFEMLVVHFWRGEHDRTVKDFWLLPTQRQYLSTISIVPWLIFSTGHGAYAAEKDPSIQVLYTHPIEENTGSEPCRQLIRNWIDYCVKNDACPLPPINSIPLPTRVIDVGNAGDTYVSLHVTKDSDIQHGRYMTLSHRWGDANLPKCTRRNIGSLQQGFDLSGLPRTFRDAVQVTRDLQVRFLWIDSLCILQDSTEDWAQEAGMMGNVYQNCFINIAATAAQNSDSGLFFDRRKRDAERLEVEIDWLSEDVPTSPSNNDASRPKYVSCYCWDPDLWSFEVELAVVNTRGWVAQERLFAPRILHFGKNQLLWECSARAACEMSPGGDPDLSVGSQLRPWKHLADCFRDAGTTPICSLTNVQRFSKWQAWWDFVEAYTTREFTYTSDKLIAIAAVANAMIRQHEGVPEDYFAGLWQWWLELDLCWHVSHNRQPPLSFKKTVRPDDREAWRAPSWSWASVDGPVIRAYVDRKDEVMPLIRLLDTSIVALHSGNRTGQLKHAALKAECRVFHACWSLPPLTNVSRNGAQLLGAPGNGPLSGSLSFDDYNQASAMAGSSNVELQCIPIMRTTRLNDPLGNYFIHGLLVKAVGEGCFLRIGHFMVNGSLDNVYSLLGKERVADSTPAQVTLV